jgi:2-polyprenyl-3-methyl-5-hydroxy-6-metoxy-1,4-benzoquinol methylase
MECDDVTLLQQWLDAWADLVEFEVYPVITSAEAAARVPVSSAGPARAATPAFIPELNTSRAELLAQMAHSWNSNAQAWTRLVRNAGIESRRVATDAAIIAAVTARSPRRVLDAGCGEGWLCRALEARGIDVVGIDASASLVASARAASKSEYHQVSYEELVAQPAPADVEHYDAIVCNFSLLHEDLEPLLRRFGSMLGSNGALLIQTVHPWSARGDDAYADAWRTESFASFEEEFPEPMPWYYRTVGSWTQLLGRAGFALEQLIEPTHPQTGTPLSLLLVATPRAV